MNFIKEINIYIKTNAKQETKSEDEPETTGEATAPKSNSEYTLFTHSMIYQPPVPSFQKEAPKKSTVKYNSKPYFTNYIKYSNYNLKSYLYMLGYDEILKFFFNKTHFKRVLFQNGIELKRVSLKTMNENSSDNIEFMLELLFPTTFPSFNNMFSSYDELFENAPNFKMSSFVNYLPQPLKEVAMITNKFSYIKIGDGIKTIYRVVLINDIMNHPKYNFLIRAVNQFMKKFEIERKDIIKGLATKFIGIAPVFEQFTTGDDDVSLLERNAKKGYANPSTGEITELNKTKSRLKNLLYDFDRYFENENEFKKIKKDTRSNLINTFIEKNPNLDMFDNLQTELMRIINKSVYSQYNQSIKDYLIYYEIYKNYYQYDESGKIPKIKNIYYKKKDDREMDPYGRFGRIYDIQNDAKRQMQSDNITRNYKNLFDAFKNVSFDKLLTDNEDFNELIKSFIDEDVEPDIFLLKLYNILSLLTPKRDYSISKELDKKIEDTEKSNMKKYCKMTVVNSIDKTGEKPTNYEVYIHLDLMDGEVNNDNLSKIRCKYRGKQLGHLYLKYTLPYEFWEIKSLPFLRVDNLLDKTAKKQNKADGKAKDVPNPPNENKQVALPVQGGRVPTRKTRRRYVRRISRFRNTRKNNLFGWVE